MRRRALAVLACPECGAPFPEVVPEPETIESATLRCAGGHDYRVEQGIPLLVPEADRPRLRSFAESYAQAWARDGWGSLDPEYLRNLPYRDVTHRHRMEWRVKARSMDALLPALDVGRPLRVADLGCGMGWLAHHLALQGHEVYAVDALLDDTLGLGACGAYVRMGPYFERVCGEIERPPFLDRSLDVVICNASLHYVARLDRALAAISRILRPGGFLLILNSPVYRDRASASRGELSFRAHLEELGSGEAVASTYHHFVRSELESAVRDAIGPLREIPFDPGVWFCFSRRVKGVALRMELARFPILMASKPDGSPSYPA